MRYIIIGTLSFLTLHCIPSIACTIQKIKFINKSSNKQIIYQQQHVAHNGSIQAHFLTINPHEQSSYTINKDHYIGIGRISISSFADPTIHTLSLYNYQQLLACKETLINNKTQRRASSRRSSQNSTESTLRTINTIINNTAASENWIINYEKNYDSCIEFVQDTKPKTIAYNATIKLDNNHKNFIMRYGYEYANTSKKYVTSTANTSSIYVPDNHDNTLIITLSDTVATDNQQPFSMHVAIESNAHYDAFANTIPTNQLIMHEIPYEQTVQIPLDTIASKTLTIELINSKNTSESYTYTIHQDNFGIIRISAIEKTDPIHAQYIKYTNNLHNTWLIKHNTLYSLDTLYPPSYKDTQQAKNIELSIVVNESEEPTVQQQSRWLSSRSIAPQLPLSMHITLKAETTTSKPTSLLRSISRRFSQFFQPKKFTPIHPAQPSIVNDTHTYQTTPSDIAAQSTSEKPTPERKDSPPLELVPCALSFDQANDNNSDFNNSSSLEWSSITDYNNEEIRDAEYEALHLNKK